MQKMQILQLNEKQKKESGLRNIIFTIFVCKYILFVTNIILII